MMGEKSRAQWIAQNLRRFLAMGILEYYMSEEEEVGDIGSCPCTGLNQSWRCSGLGPSQSSLDYYPIFFASLTTYM
jgi:hypothetical protein